MSMIKGIKSCRHAGFKCMVFGLREGDMTMSLYSNTTLLSTQLRKPFNDILEIGDLSHTSIKSIVPSISSACLEVGSLQGF